MNRKIIYALCVSVFLVPAIVSAHQPRLVGEAIDVTVKNPEISQAFYGELRGKSAVYRLRSDSPFVLYVNLLSPFLPDARKDFGAVIYKDGAVFAALPPSASSWEKWHEEFAGDDYYRGTEFRATTTPGSYEIRVENASSSGKYVIAIGEIELFPVDESLHTLKILPSLKAFFGKPWYAMFEGVIGHFLLGAVVVFLLLFVLVLRLIHRRK